MSNRRAQSLPPHMLDEKPERGRCITAICFSWKVITCIVSHVTLILLVVSYCIGGAFLFQQLEGPHEKKIKEEIQTMRQNITDRVWDFSNHEPYLNEVNWILEVSQYLENFENQILCAMKKEGWDGDEDKTKHQWSFSGSLFYSIIVITTIGYGHISPRTDWGKVATIFYAIVGIPLMLLCLSNIGDVMATSFRFIYWRVCCYICTRKSQRPRHRSGQRSMRVHRYASRSQPPPMRRSMRLTQRSAADSGVGPSIGLPHAYSDPELRTLGEFDRDYRHGRAVHRGVGSSSKRNQHIQPPITHGGKHTVPYEAECFNEERMNYTQTLNRASRYSSRQKNRDRMHDRHTIEREGHFSRSKQHLGSMEELTALPPLMKRTLSSRSMRSPNQRRDEIPRDVRETRELNRNNSHHTPRGRSVPNSTRARTKSVTSSPYCEDLDEEIVRKTPIISNRYAIDQLDHHRQRPKNSMRSQSMPRSALHKNNYNDALDPLNGKYKRLQRNQIPNHPQGRQYHSSRFGNHLELPEFVSPPINHSKRRGRPPLCDEYDDDFEECFPDEHEAEVAYSDHSSYHRRQPERKHRRDRPERLPPSPRIMSPMGFAVKRQIRRRPSPNYDYDDDSMYGDEWSDYFGDIPPKDRPVPIWLCVFLVISYILGGAALFSQWEKWSYLDSAYFCFITLTTIGFGDFVPAKGVKEEEDSKKSIAYCSLYLLFGIALLAMSFNLVQEEFIANVKEVARRLGILKDEDDD